MSRVDGARQLLGWKTVPTASTLYLPFLALATVLPWVTIAIFFDARKKGHPVGDMVSAIAFFLMLSLILLLQGLSNLRSARARSAGRKAAPDQPWQWDHAWDPRGALDRTRDFWKNLVLFVVPAGLILAVMHAFVVMDGGATRTAWLALGLVDVLVLIFVALIGYRLWQRVKYGDLSVQYATFPYFTGEPFEVTLKVGARVSEAEKLTATLRCVQEHDGTAKQPGRIAYELYSDRVECDVASAGAARMEGLPIRFEIPADALSTDLVSDPPRYWDVEVHAPAAGVDYKGHFLAPIYRRPK